MNDQLLEQIHALACRDVAGRGLQSDPHDNLVTASRGDFVRSCRAIAGLDSPHIVIVTGFTVPTADPPCGETDGPLGALYIARAWAPLGIRVTLVSDGTTLNALQATGDIHERIAVAELPDEDDPDRMRRRFHQQVGDYQVLIALERVGPSHADGRCYSMRGQDVTQLHRPAHWLFESSPAITIGIGDGGNEIGMGKIPHSTIARNIPNGEQVACRTATDHLIVAGISNWGAMALAAGVSLLRYFPMDASLFNPTIERDLLKRMVEAGPLVDGLSGKQELSVDGIPFEDYFAVALQIEELLRGNSPASH